MVTESQVGEPFVGGPPERDFLAEKLATVLPGLYFHERSAIVASGENLFADPAHQQTVKELARLREHYKVPAAGR